MDRGGREVKREKECEEAGKEGGTEGGEREEDCYFTKKG